MWYDAIIEIRNNANKDEGVIVMRVDIAKLRGKIAERGLTQEKLAIELAMDKSTLSRKMKSEGLEFSIGDMHRLVGVLNLTKKDASEIFLS